MPKRLLYAERLRRRLRVRFAGIWIADSEMPIRLEPGQTVIPHGPDRELTAAEVLPRNEP